jgi:hypothetical protein
MAAKTMSPATGTGVRLGCDAPVPRRPPLPQQETKAEPSLAQVWLPPGAICTLEEIPTTAVGTLFLSLVPSPISPFEFLPQQ